MSEHQQEPAREEQQGASGPGAPASSGQSEGGIYRHILTGTGVYSIGVIASRMASVLLLPVYTRYLSPTDYGVLELLDLTLYVIGTLVGMRIGDALMFEWADSRENGERQKTLVSTAYIGSVLIAVLAAAAGWAASGSLSTIVFGESRYAPAFRIMFGSFGASLPLEVALSYARARDLRNHYLAFSLGRLALTALLNLYFLVFLHWGYEAMLWGGLAGAGVLSVGGGWYCMVATGARFAFSTGLFRRMLGYGAPLGLSGLGFLIIHYGDRYFLKQHVTLAEIGVYSLAYKIGMLVANLQTPFDVYWRAQMFKIVERPDGDRIFARVCTYLTLALMSLAVFLMAFAPLIMQVMAGPAFQKSAQYVPWIGIAYVVRAVGGHFRNVFLLAGKTGLDAVVVWVSALACLAGYWLLIPRWLAWGAVVSTVLGFAVMLVLGLWQAQRSRSYPYEYRRLGLAFLAAAPVAGLMAAYHPAGVLPQLGLGCCAFLLYAVLLGVMGFVEAEEWATLKRAARGILPGT